MESSLNENQDHLGFRVAYDGKSFQGFQAQIHSKSVQQWIEKALSIFFRRSLRIRFSSRTDTGVHAYDQVVMIQQGYSLYERLTNAEKARCLFSINSLLQRKVFIWQMLRLKAEFQPRKHISWKEYHYRIFEGSVSDPLLIENSWWIRSPLNTLRMKKALLQLRGIHDFSGFTTKKRTENQAMNPIRKILKVELDISKHKHIDRLRLLTFRFRGEGFLYRMVRNMVAALVEIGRGKEMGIDKILDSRKRPGNLVSAPPEGLILVKSHIPKQFISKILVNILFVLAGASEILAADFTGSAALSASQRFFSDEKLGHVNGFSQWGAIQFDVKFGLYEFPFGIEPIIGFSFLRNSASLYALDDAGNYVLDAEGNRMESSVDRLEYQLYTASYGVRYKAWQPDFFWLIPYAEALQTLCYGRVKKVTFALDQQKLNTGIDMGFEFGGGLLLSFMFDQSIRNDLKMEWDMKDFGLMSSVHYLSSGLYRRGLGLLTSTGGWSFGLGLLLDW